MKNSMREKLAQLDMRQAEVDAMLQQPDVTNDIDNYRKLTKEHAEITPVVVTFNEYIQTEQDIASAQELMSDPELKAFAQEEYQAGKTRLDELADALQTMLLKTTSATSYWKSVQAQAATSRRCLRAICCACTRATPSARVGRLKS